MNTFIQSNQNLSFGNAANTAEYQLNDLVFTSPTEAWFMYEIHTTTVGVLGNRFGIVRLVDGDWRFARAVVCQDLSLAGAPCSPAVNDIQPPAG